MARPKKEKDVENVEKVEKVESEVEQLPQEIVKEAVTENVEALKKENVELKKQIAQITKDLQEVLPKLQEKVENAGLSTEQKKALEFCFQWVAHLRRQSRNVQFRQEAQDAIAALSKLL